MPLLEDYAAYDLPDASFIFIFILSLDPRLQKNAHIAQAGGFLCMWPTAFIKH